MQDQFGLSVPLVLWCVWTGAHFAEPDPATLKRAMMTGDRWEQLVIARLRMVRRTLKNGFDGAPAETVRADVNAAELAAERELLARLEALTRDVVTATADSDVTARARRTLAAYVRAAGAAGRPGFSIALLEEVVGLTVEKPIPGACQNPCDT